MIDRAYYLALAAAAVFLAILLMVSGCRKKEAFLCVVDQPDGTTRFVECPDPPKANSLEGSGTKN